MSSKPIFSLEGLTKAHGRKTVLKDVSLTFLEDAKIGVIGQNGAGKSSLLRIMAGDDTEFDGVARLADGKTVGFVPQEPKLDEDKTVLGNVELAVAPIRAMLKTQEDLSEKLGTELEPDEMEKVPRRRSHHVPLPPRLAFTPCIHMSRCCGGTRRRCE